MKAERDKAMTERDKALRDVLNLETQVTDLLDQELEDSSLLKGAFVHVFTCILCILIIKILYFQNFRSKSCESRM